jgi:protease YdgD
MTDAPKAAIFRRIRIAGAVMPRLFISLILLTLSAPAFAQDDSCEYALDRECDEARYDGTGACADGTDTADCRLLAQGLSDDSCEWANDGECDEPRYFDATGACVNGTDATDCRGQELRADALDRLMEALPASLRSQLGTDSCQYADDGECDDTAFGGTGACAAGTDASDCRALAIGGEDSCQWANDGECDEPGIGGGYCASGTDLSDCATVAFLRNRDDTCNTAFNSICDEPSGTGLCALYTDTADCEGRGRPAEAGNHYFGRDDRILMDTTQMPWRAIGLLTMREGTCTGTLFGPHHVITAAHCLTADGKTLDMPLTFHAGLTRGDHLGKSAVVDAWFAPDYSPDTAAPGEGNGEDWAIVLLADDIGLTAGMLDIHMLTQTDIDTINGEGMLVNQAGYSWDTGRNLSGNRGCRLTRAFADDSFLHECDTTYGDSGSPILMRRGDDWEIIGLDSQYFDPESKNSAFQSGNLAVDSRAFFRAAMQALAQ